MIFGEFCDVFPPELDGVGGVVKSYAKGLCEMGDTAYFIAPKGKDPVGNRPFPLLFCHSFPLPGEPYHVGVPSLDFGFRRRLAEIPFDIAHAHSPFGAGSAARAVARKKGIPLVATFHSKYYDDFLAKTHSKRLAALGTRIVVNFYNTCDEVWAVNSATADVLHSYGYDREIRVMPNGTDPWTPQGNQEERLRAVFGEHDGPLFLFVGQHHWKKNIKTVLEAAAIYGKSHPFRLLFIGQGPDEDAIKRLAIDLGIGPRTRFLGHIADRETLMQLFAAADLFLFPSLYDNAPMVVREAAAAGTPSVLVRGACATEGTTDGVNAFHTDNTPQAMAKVMEAALPVAAEVGMRARDTIPTKWSDLLLDVRARYVELIEEKRAKSAR